MHRYVYIGTYITLHIRTYTHLIKLKCTCVNPDNAKYETCTDTDFDEK